MGDARLGAGRRFSFHRVAGHEPPHWPGNHGEQQVHLDLLVDDLLQACAEVEAVGATALTEVMDPGPKAWRIHADPAGHPLPGHGSRVDP